VQPVIRSPFWLRQRAKHDNLVLSIPLAGRGSRALPAQAALDRVEEDGCHSSPPRHVRDYGTPPLPT
jgi:hypothetical protein